MLHFRGGRDIDATVYPDLSDYFDDLATTWRDAIRAFYDAGCRYLQLDDTVWAYLCSDAQRQQYVSAARIGCAGAYLCPG